MRKNILDQRDDTNLGLKSSLRICLMTCFNGHSSSMYNLAINAFFFSHTSEEIDVFILFSESEKE